MEKIKRYEIDATDMGGTTYYPNDAGFWVRYEDHERIVEDLNYELRTLRNALVKLQGVLNETHF